jgi:hypothetical protein
MDNSIDISKFSKHLFWDVDRNKLCLSTNKTYIIKQVLEYGLLDDWIMLQKHYGIEQIAQTAKTFRDLDKKTLSFVAFLSQSPKHHFKCYSFQQSIPQLWNF